MSIRPVERALALGCAVLCGLAACGWPGEHGAGHAVAAATASSASPQHAPRADSDMVSAVSAGKGGGLPVDVKFALRQRPEVGQSAELDLIVIPSAPLDRLMTSFRAEEGLTLSDGAQPSVQDRPEPGVPIPHALTIVPKQDGIFYVDATVLADSGTESIARTFTIPVIAGGGAQ
jgi:hypothetical protein